MMMRCKNSLALILTLFLSFIFWDDLGPANVEITDYH